MGRIKYEQPKRLDRNLLDYSYSLFSYTEIFMIILFKINFAKNDKFSSSIIYDKSKNEIEINRLYSGMNRDTIGTRKVKVRYPKQSLKLRVILDKYSVEIFVNDGSQVLSMTYYTPVEADEISFECNNTAVINIEKHGISVR